MRIKLTISGNIRAIFPTERKPFALIRCMSIMDIMSQLELDDQHKSVVTIVVNKLIKTPLDFFRGYMVDVYSGQATGHAEMEEEIFIDGCPYSFEPVLKEISLHEKLQINGITLYLALDISGMSVSSADKSMKTYEELMDVVSALLAC